MAEEGTQAMTMRVLDNGNFLHLKPAYGPGGAMGDGAIEVGPEYPDWPKILRDLAIQDDAETRKMDRIRGEGYCSKHAKRFPGDDF